LTPFILIAVLLVGSYFIGSLPFGLWIGLSWKKVDIRTLGSKNIGATNVLRVLGPGPGITVFVLDTLKGAVALFAAHVLLPDAPPPALIGIGFAAVLGHTFSPFLGFKGGKGVATSLGMLFALSWQVALVALIAWGIVLAATRFVSLASLVAAFTLPFTPALCLKATPDMEHWMLGLGILVAVMVAVKHRSNIERLLNGTEPKIGQRVPATSPTEGVEP
jgi:glycerol-3-phosphate acyltransferase PlsY